mmetsp:Transcript_42314/g.62787  ORF Transcript_42314/g.62787 Transcript_42314/m.62787 type:complete len:88 (-) Transcript_42314:483-746(-)
MINKYLTKPELNMKDSHLQYSPSSREAESSCCVSCDMKQLQTETNLRPTQQQKNTHHLFYTGTSGTFGASPTTTSTLPWSSTTIPPF